MPPVNVTNEGKEVRVKKIFEENALEEDSEYIIVDPENPVPNPELGPLERRVSVTFEEGLALDTIDKDAMQYWFTEPPQGWQTEKRKLKKAHGIPVEDNIDDYRHKDRAGNRTPLSEIRIGDILTGTVVEQSMYHGLRVDVGAEVDGLIPIRGIEMWKAVEKSGHLPNIGDAIAVEVYAIREDPVFRFPLQIAPTNDKLSSMIPPPEEHKPPLDLRDVPISRYEEVAQISGRDWGSQKVLVTPADIEDVVIKEGDAFEISQEDLDLFDSIVAELDL
jgi:uncharacterized protein YrzB (UPF0473 family)